MMDKQNWVDQEYAAQLYSTLCGRQDLMTVLTEMQKEKGISAEQADKNAKALIHAVTTREVLFDQVSSNRNTALEGVLNKFARMNSARRKEMLHRLHFGLSLHQDPELSSRVQNGESVEWLFQSYYEQYGRDPEMTEELLEEKIRVLVADCHISPQTLRAFAGRAKLGDELAAASALGEEGKLLKCVAAMDLYLRNQDTMTVEEAANAACTDVELQAAADACSSGLLTEEQVLLLMAVASLVCMFLACYWVGDVISLSDHIMHEELMVPMPTGGDGEFTKAFIDAEMEKMGIQRVKYSLGVIAASVASIGLEAMSPAVSKWCGKLATKQRFVRSREESRVAQTLDTMADHVQARKEAAAPKEDPERQREEARRQAFEREQAAAKARRMQTFS